MKAKDPDRNGLCVYLYKRSGGDPVMVREQWKKKGCLGLDERLCRFADMFHHEMFPDKAAYDVRSAAQIYMNWNVVSQDLLIRDLERLLNKKRSGRGIRQVHEEDIAFLKEVVREKGCLKGLADELILARKIADHHYGAPFWSGKVGVASSLFLTIHPHDPVIVRDARPFRFGNRCDPLDWPYPSVLAGSVRTMTAKMKGLEFTPESWFMP